MDLVAHWRLSKQALIDLAFFCRVPIVLAMLRLGLRNNRLGDTPTG